MAISEPKPLTFTEPHDLHFCIVFITHILNEIPYIIYSILSPVNPNSMKSVLRHSDLFYLFVRAHQLKCRPGGLSIIPQAVSFKRVSRIRLPYSIAAAIVSITELF